MKRLKLNSLITLAITMLMLSVMTGCGGKQVKPAAQAVATEEPASTNSAVTAEKLQTVKHANGETSIPVNPSRVVVLDNGALDNLLALGVKPVGAPSIVAVEDGYASYLQDTEGITNIGTVEQPSLETIASLKPDLIIGIKDTQEAIYEQLQQIAPTVFTEVGGAEWEKNLTFHALVVGKVAEGEKLFVELDAHIAKLKEKLGDKLTSTEVSLLRPRKDRVSVYLKPSFTGGVVERMGIKRPAAQDKTDDFNFNVTDEQIAELDGDVIILFGRESEQQYFNDKIKSNPLWNTLEAVKQNRVYMADWEVWLSGHGIQAVNRMVEDMGTFLDQ
ncbi:ABC transporter substrate-binding protein [Paenibacillus sinopodophylli]|uniref:ABC transporter substrate-binding protein n=1 Tax=Paenibacillus sinopodophylli TaxID=1837342 RepID=UPI00110D13FF|nr:iron-siderophore ABC transporter substrate-binding protein [Paenibacillus sinopodophylli]